MWRLRETQVIVDAQRVVSVRDDRKLLSNFQLYADVAELVDALASGASVSNDVEVQVLLSAPTKESTHAVGFFVGMGGVLTKHYVSAIMQVMIALSLMKR